MLLPSLTKVLVTGKNYTEKKINFINQLAKDITQCLEVSHLRSDLWTLDATKLLFYQKQILKVMKNTSIKVTSEKTF